MISHRGGTVPYKPLKPCRYPGCPNLTSERFCKDHQHEAEIQKAKANRYYDQHIRDKKAEAFYKSKAWVRTREYVLDKYNHIDLYDYYINQRITKANTVHHIIELNEDWDRRLDIGNLFPLSSANHNVIDGYYRKDKKAAQKLLFQLIEKWETEKG